MARTRFLPALAVGVLLLVASCGSSDDDDANGGPLPVDAMLIDYFGTDDLDEYQVGVQRRVATLIVECMDERGWPYEIAPAFRWPRDTEDPDTLEYAETQGFGVVSDFERLVAFENGAGLSGVDPNRGYLETLTADGIAGYLTALQGGDSTSGCTNWAADEAWSDWNRFHRELPWFSGLAEERDAHRTLSAVRERWQVCMADRGWEYREPAAIEEDVRLRLGEMFQEQQMGNAVVSTDDALVLTEEAEALLAELAIFERSVAVDNFNCLEPERSLIREAEAEVQQTFVDGNADAINRLLAGG